jgi:hypothetical protein
MDQSSSVGGTNPSEEIPGFGEVQGMSQQDVGNLMHAKIANLDQLKAVLIQYMGEKQGKKFYDEFMKSIAMIMLQQIQESATQAKKASQNMRMDTQ